ncbi:MAG: 3',5'-cyclic-nucleotide phosphodiesterase [Pseudomonadota bacterium]|nr:3',5'-cyclic-nucleotide phosphodiesterase [Pseudomonadota bacterium]
MKVRVLGCSGAIAKGCQTTAFLVNQDTLIDAGTGVGELTLQEMARVQDVFLTHSHLDHVACLPLMADSVAASRIGRPLRVHALPATIEALKQYLFNDHIWPDFTRIPSAEQPLIAFHPLDTGTTRTVGQAVVQALPANHSVPAVGYAVRDLAPDAPWWVFSGDTERNPAFWQRINHMHVGALVIETAFSNRERELARRSMHLSPAVLADELDHIDPARRFPIYITHTKPHETETIMREITQFDQVRPPLHEVTHDIRWLSAGHVFDW